MAKPGNRIFLETALALNAAGDAAPVQVAVIPAGEQIRGIDGRAWHNPSSTELVAALNAYPTDLPIDWNHSTELRAPKGEESPAAGWMKAGRYALGGDGAILAEVAWNSRGEASITGREYRYLSPALIYERATRRLTGLSSVGLVPKPNLTQLPGLNSVWAPPEESTMTPEQLKALCAALGTAEGADADTIIAQATQLKSEHAKALNAAQPDLSKLVPRADYETALNRAKTAEDRLADQATAALKSEGTGLVEAAVKAGQIAPASKDFYLGLCATETGLNSVKEFLKTAPKVIADGEAARAGTPPESADTALNTRNPLFAEAFGNSAEDLKKFG